MEITVSEEKARVPVTVLHVRGPVTDDEQLRQTAQQAFDSGARNMLLDLSGVPYMASSGLRALHAIFTMLRSSGAGEDDASVQAGIRSGTYKSPHLKLVSPTRDVLEVLRSTGYDMFLDIHKNLKEALASF